MKVHPVWMWGLVIATSIASSYVLTTWLPPPPQNFANPDYDSGWIQLGQPPMRGGTETKIVHNLGTADIFVYILAKEEYFQADDKFSSEGEGDRTLDVDAGDTGYYWYTTEPNNIWVISNYDEIRVLIWKLP